MRGQKARDRYVEVAAALKAEAGVDEHTVNKGLSGRARLGSGLYHCAGGDYPQPALCPCPRVRAYRLALHEQHPEEATTRRGA